VYLWDRDLPRSAQVFVLDSSFTYFDGYDYFGVLFTGFEHFVPIDAAPGWNIVFRARVGAYHIQPVTFGQLGNGVLRPDDRHRAQ
jgi:hypothetical protein